MKEHEKIDLFTTFKDLSIVFHHKEMRHLLTGSLLFSIGWEFFLVFSPTFFVQKFSLTADKIGDIFAYMAICWTFSSMYLNKELTGKFSLQALCLIGLLISSIGIALFVWPDHLWPYWIIIPLTLTGGAFAWVNLNALVSTRASESMQGRAMGANGSMWAIGQIVAPLVAGPLAGWNLYSPLLLGAVIVFLAFIYFVLIRK